MASTEYSLRLQASERAKRNYKKYLLLLVKAVSLYLHAIDAEMQTPSSSERGGRIAKLTGALELANDQARYFALGIDFRTDKKVRTP